MYLPLQQKGQGILCLHYDTIMTLLSVRTPLSTRSVLMSAAVETVSCRPWIHFWLANQSRILMCCQLDNTQVHVHWGGPAWGKTHLNKEEKNYLHKAFAILYFNFSPQIKTSILFFPRQLNHLPQTKSDKEMKAITSLSYVKSHHVVFSTNVCTYGHISAY